jgi:hypothetical protein
LPSYRESSEHDEFRYAEAVEHRHIGAAPSGEREEVREIFRRYGLHGDLLERVVETITVDRQQWLRIMLREEYGLPAVVRMPWRSEAAREGSCCVTRASA